MTLITDIEASLNFLEPASMTQHNNTSIESLYKTIYSILEYFNLERHMEVSASISQINVLDFTNCVINSHTVLNESSVINKQNTDFVGLLFEYVLALVESDVLSQNESAELIISEIFVIISAVSRNYAEYIYKKYLNSILDIYYSGEKLSLLLIYDVTNIPDSDTVLYDLLEAQYKLNSIMDQLSIVNIVALNNKLSLNADFLTKFLDV